MTKTDIETTIFNNLVHNEDYMRKVLPFLKTEYFSHDSYKTLFSIISRFVDKYNASPTPKALQLELDNIKLSTDTYNRCLEIVEHISLPFNSNLDWIVDETEKFCQDKAIYNAIMESIQIIDGSSKDKDKGYIPQVLQEALGVCFDANVGHDLLEDVDERYEFYHRVLEKIPFDLELFNKITRGGLPNKTLNVCIAGTGVGKTLMMCHFATANLLEGRNVLYITMEMAEEKIAERIDANLMKVPLNEIENLSKEAYQRKIKKVKEKTRGKLVVKEYPTASVHSGHFRHLLNELKMKKNFVPDIIYVDYLNICASSRLRMGGAVNTYSYVKAIAEELRGLAVEFDLPIFSATQTNRTGFVNSDFGLEDTSESFGLPQTVDFMFAAIRTDQLDELNQILIKQLKNRYNNPNYYKRFVIGVDFDRMTLYNCEQIAQENIIHDERPSNLESGFKSPMANKFDRLRGVN